jgi:hypothetical protein
LPSSWQLARRGFVANMPDTRHLRDVW